MNIKQDKRKYVSPELIAVAIDQEITLVMVSDPGGGETPPFPASSVGSSGITIDNSNTLSSDTPFGSDSPDYSKE